MNNLLLLLRNPKRYAIHQQWFFNLPLFTIYSTFHSTKRKEKRMPEGIVILTRILLPLSSSSSLSLLLSLLLKMKMKSLILARLFWISEAKQSGKLQFYIIICTIDNEFFFSFFLSLYIEESSIPLYLIPFSRILLIFSFIKIVKLRCDSHQKIMQFNL